MARKSAAVAEGRESPARRLGILYLVSLSAISLLSVLNQGFVGRELRWQAKNLGEVVSLARAESLDQSLSHAALMLLASDDPDDQNRWLHALRDRAKHLAATSPVTPNPETARPSDDETNRDEALAAAEQLLARCDQAGLEALSSTELRSLVRQIHLAETQFHREIDGNILQDENVATDRMVQLWTLGSLLFTYVLVILLLEGLFVVSPAVRDIQRFMTEMRQSHAVLTTYAARLEQSNRELQDFASVASHDLQEPLRKVQAFSDRLRRRCGDVLDDQGRDYLDRIQNAAGRMQSLINDLLTYSRITTKAQPFTQVDLVTAAREVVSDLEVRIEQTGGRVEVDGLPTLDADPLQIRQLLQNLIGNALKYHRPEVSPVVRVGGRNLRLGDPEAPGSDRPYCQIRIEDNGIGFEDIHRERIFRMFQRLHGRGEYEGTGVGLAVCRKIVERHGGTIIAHGVPDKGATFVVTLPVMQPEVTRDV